MQRKAMERVEAMRKKTAQVLEETSAEAETEREIKREPVLSPKITNMPANFPKDKLYPDFGQYFSEKIDGKPVIKRKKEENGVSSDILNNIIKEPDKAILSGLIMLLKSEGADKALIMALMYIMS